VAGVALCGSLCAQAPYYTAAGIGNASDYSAGPFAPGSVLSLYGTNLAWTTAAITAAELAAGSLPTQLAGAEVMVDNVPVPMLYASPTQVNFLMPIEQIPGDVSVTEVRQGQRGPAVTIPLVAAAPALFAAAGGFVLAQDWNTGYTLMTAAAPANAGDIVILYATGLGYTSPPWVSGAVPQHAFQIASKSSLQVLLDGTPVDPSLILYAGVTPGFLGLYQVNFKLPAGASANPEIRVQMVTRISIPAIHLAVN
jgi:uncharacterized protein (TIGR03437 family)